MRLKHVSSSSLWHCCQWQWNHHSNHYPIIISDLTAALVGASADSDDFDRSTEFSSDPQWYGYWSLCMCSLNMDTTHADKIINRQRFLYWEPNDALKLRFRLIGPVQMSTLSTEPSLWHILHDQWKYLSAGGCKGSKYCVRNRTVFGCYLDRGFSVAISVMSEALQTRKCTYWLKKSVREPSNTWHVHCRTALSPHTLIWMNVKVWEVVTVDFGTASWGNCQTGRRAQTQTKHVMYS